MAINLIVGEYTLLWKALKHYEKHLLNRSEATTDEDERLSVDEALIKIEGMFHDIRGAAKRDWGLDLT
jgi:tRNA U34 5-methylaminomethyl-2-thiouridine-forming methyltransferase MnmC